MPFLLRDGATGRPTTFEAIFSFVGCRYVYSFSYVGDRITEETFKASSPKTGRMNLVFHRGEHGVSSKAARRNGFGKSLEEKTRPETLLITKGREDNNLFSAAVFALVESTPVMLDQGSGYSPQFVEMLKRNEDLRARIHGEHSALSMFDEYSMTSPKGLAEYAGFTADDVRQICGDKGLIFDAMRDWYDGYRLSNHSSRELVGDAGVETDAGRVYEIYAPLSVVSAVRFRRLENYWARTETYEALSEYICMDLDGLKEAVVLLMDGGRLRIDTSTYQNDMATFHSRDDVLSLLAHLGYLGFDDERDEVFIPNREIMAEFASSTKTAEWHTMFVAYERSKELCHATLSADAERVAELSEEAHDETGNKTYNDGAALSYAIQLAYYAARRYYTTVLELDSGDGYADVVYLPVPARPDLPAIVVELKYDKDADTAMDQIKRRRYPQRLEHYRDNMLHVGINYDRDATTGDSRFKHHTCVIESA